MQPAIIQEPLPAADDHLFNVPGTEWAFWRWVCLRSAGFPANDVSRLAGPAELISGTTEAQRALEQMEAAREKALQQVNTALDCLRSSGQWEDKSKRSILLDARRDIVNGTLPRQPLSERLIAQAVDELRVAMHNSRVAQQAFKDAFSKSIEQTSNTIREIAGTGLLREAVAWQNRAALETALDPLLRSQAHESPRGSKQKQHEELTAGYWQRYCTKNDTIGFFGPVGWAQITPEIMHLAMSPGESLLARRRTYWESWAMEALGAAITRKYNIQPWICPIVVPLVRITGRVLHHPVYGTLRITAKEAALLRACDGRLTAKQIAGKLQGASGAGYGSENEVYSALSDLSSRGFVFWKFNVPLGTHPEQDFRRALEKIENAEIRKHALGLVEELEAAKARLDGSAGDPEKLSLAFQNLEQLFTRLTETAPTRNAGKVYAGRTLVYEDCCRDVKVELGPDLIKALTDPLSLLLTTARWFTSRLAEVYHAKLLEIHSELARQTGGNVVDAALFWVKVAPLFFDNSETLTASAEEEFRGKWERVLQLGTGRAPVHFSSDELRRRVMREFPPSRRGWLHACYHSPDIMIAAESDEAIRRNEYVFVLGEVHVSLNTLDAQLFVNQHPSPHELLEAIYRDLGEQHIVPVGLMSEDLGCRTTRALIPETNLRLEYLPDSLMIDRSKALPIASLVIENCGGQLVAKSRDGAFCLPAIDLAGVLLSRLAADCFRIITHRQHVPRISIDKLVIKRESWRFSASEMPFANASDPAERFLHARMWSQQNGIPRHVFFKVPVENKPAYLDFDSPILIDMFAKMVRRTLDAGLPNPTVDLSEMLPALNQLWLADAQDRRYTSELRFVAVDTAGLETGTEAIL